MSFKILFMGTPSFSVPILKSLNLSNHKILEVYTQPPKKKDRGQKISFSSVHRFSNEINIPVRYPTTLRSKVELEHIKQLKPDIVVVVAYGQIIPSEFLDLQNILFINIHASLLPKWRGAAPIQRAIMNCDNETGISIMKIEEELDAGPILLKSKIEITKNNNYEELSNKMSSLGAKLILDALDLISKKKANFVPQQQEKATYAKKIKKTESKIDWNLEAKNIVAKVNAFYPNPGCWFNLKGSRIKIIKAVEIQASGPPGEIINNSFTIGCSENAIQILELQKEGKNKISAKEFLKGNNLEVGFNILKDV
ncbi:MAG: methionyl-tRNA formyltransferase [Gammaproteobacteria bacterium]|nr:methionyl-tRNA formyltransferase [Gammaproteobacteria bacterium]